MLTPYVFEAKGSPSATLDQNLSFDVSNLSMLTDLVLFAAVGLLLFSRVKNELNFLLVAFRFRSEHPEVVESRHFR